MMRSSLVKSCGQILSSEGYTVFTEGRGKSALDKFAGIVQTWC